MIDPHATPYYGDGLYAGHSGWEGGSPAHAAHTYNPNDSYLTQQGTNAVGTGNQPGIAVPISRGLRLRFPRFSDIFFAECGAGKMSLGGTLEQGLLGLRMDGRASFIDADPMHDKRQAEKKFTKSSLNLQSLAAWSLNNPFISMSAPRKATHEFSAAAGYSVERKNYDRRAKGERAGLSIDGPNLGEQHAWSMGSEASQDTSFGLNVLNYLRVWAPAGGLLHYLDRGRDRFGAQLTPTRVRKRKQKAVVNTFHGDDTQCMFLAQKKDSVLGDNWSAWKKDVLGKYFIERGYRPDEIPWQAWPKAILHLAYQTVRGDSPCTRFVFAKLTYLGLHDRYHPSDGLITHLFWAGWSRLTMGIYGEEKNSPYHILRLRTNEEALYENSRRDGWQLPLRLYVHNFIKNPPLPDRFRAWLESRTRTLRAYCSRTDTWIYKKCHIRLNNWFTFNVQIDVARSVETISRTAYKAIEQNGQAVTQVTQTMCRIYERESNYNALPSSGMYMGKTHEHQSCKQEVAFHADYITNSARDTGQRIVNETLANVRQNFLNPLHLPRSLLKTYFDESTAANILAANRRQQAALFPAGYVERVDGKIVSRTTRYAHRFLVQWNWAFAGLANLPTEKSTIEYEHGDGFVVIPDGPTGAKCSERTLFIRHSKAAIGQGGPNVAYEVQGIWGVAQGQSDVFKHVIIDMALSLQSEQNHVGLKNVLERFPATVQGALVQSPDIERFAPRTIKVRATLDESAFQDLRRTLYSQKDNLPEQYGISTQELDDLYREGFGQSLDIPRQVLALGNFICKSQHPDVILKMLGPFCPGSGFQLHPDSQDDSINKLAASAIQLRNNFWHQPWPEPLEKRYDFARHGILEAMALHKRLESAQENARHDTLVTAECRSRTLPRLEQLIAQTDEMIVGLAHRGRLQHEALYDYMFKAARDPLYTPSQSDKDWENLPDIRRYRKSKKAALLSPISQMKDCTPAGRKVWENQIALYTALPDA